VNPDIAAHTHRYIATGAAGIVFGVSVEQARAMAERIAANPRLELVTLAMHLGSQLLDSRIFAVGARRLVELRNDLAGRGLRAIRAIDVGGGFGIRYTDEAPLDVRELAAALLPAIRDTGLELHLEPGRFLTGSAGVLLSRVLYRKRSGSKDFVVVDAAMNDLLRPSHYEARHAVVEVTARGREPRRVDVVGPVCETGDFLGATTMATAAFSMICVRNIAINNKLPIMKSAPSSENSATVRSARSCAAPVFSSAKPNGIIAPSVTRVGQSIAS
jgi:diaminopimelate decarboxylase